MAMTRMLLGEHPMDLATIFEWFAQESMTAAEQTKVPIEREMWLRLGSLWMAAAQRSHDEQHFNQRRLRIRSINMR